MTCNHQWTGASERKRWCVLCRARGRTSPIGVVPLICTMRGCTEYAVTDSSGQGQLCQNHATAPPRRVWEGAEVHRKLCLAGKIASPCIVQDGARAVEGERCKGCGVLPVTLLRALARECPVEKLVVREETARMKADRLRGLVKRHLAVKVAQ